MSESPPRALSQEATDHQNGGSGASIELPASDKAARQDPRTENPTRTLSVRIRGEQPPEQSVSRPNSRKRRRRASSLKDGFRGSLSAYRDVLNEDIEDASGHSGPYTDPLLSSQIGACLWTSTEKEAFFRKLARCDIGNIRALSAAVVTKSQTECQMYLELLRDASLRLKEVSSTSYSPMLAATEVGSELEEICNEAARELSLPVELHDEESEKETHGAAWLIDEEFACTVEQQVGDIGSPPDQGSASGEPHGATLGEENPSSDAQATAVIAPAAASLDDSGLPPSARLLRPVAFLQLSETLFMNGPPDTESNWRDLVLQSDAVPSPAIFRTAFDDFYNLTVSLTRRLVQASIFQAMSRLRAADASRPDWQPEPDVREIDVRTALDVLNMKVDTTRYWATVARRHSIEVYSDSKKYKDGREGTKTGRKLTYDEVESEVGFERSFSRGDRAMMPPSREPSSEMESEMDSDAYTLESYTGSSSREDDDESHDNDSTAGSSAINSRKCKRELDRPQVLDTAEDEYLEVLDRDAALAAESRLRTRLGLSPAMANGAPAGITQSATFRRRRIAATEDWRQRLEHEAEWERYPEGVNVQEFQSVGARGASRKRRRVEMLRGARQGDHEGSNSDSGTTDTHASKYARSTEASDAESEEESGID